MRRDINALKQKYNVLCIYLPKKLHTGVAWLSSDRVVKCEAMPSNGRNPHI